MCAQTPSNSCSTAPEAVCECVCMYVSGFVGHCLATDVFMGKLQATGWVWVIKGQADGERGHGPTNQLQELDKGASDHDLATITVYAYLLAIAHQPKILQANHWLEDVHGIY